jgi:hypothetical protein
MPRERPKRRQPQGRKYRCAGEGTDCSEPAQPQQELRLASSSSAACNCRRHFSLKCDGRPRGRHLSKRWERINLNDGKGINHEDDQTGDCRARDRGAGGCALCCRSEEAQASLAQRFDHAIRNLWDSRSIDNARILWGIRSFCWNCHRSVNRLVQLAVGRRDKRSSHLEQHQSSRSLGRRNTDAVPGTTARHSVGAGGRGAVPPCSMTTLLIMAPSHASAMAPGANMARTFNRSHEPDDARVSSPDL